VNDQHLPRVLLTPLLARWGEGLYRAQSSAMT
jgi:hypothetical protein